MSLLNSVNLLLLGAFLLFSFDTVYNAPFESCSLADMTSPRNSAEIMDDALFIAGQFLVRDILQGTVKNQELKFYEDLEAVARAAKASEIRKAGVRAGKLLKEILSGLAKDACIWASGRPETQGSGVGTTEESPVDCENVTDILRFARQQEADFIIREIRDPPLGVDGLSTSLRLRPIITSMLSHLRSKSSDLQPGSQGERQAWVVRRITPRNRCYICSSL